MNRSAAALPLLALLLCAPSARAADKAAPYVEPAQGPRMTVDNMEKRKRLLTSDWYCVREIRIDGLEVFGGDQCRIRHAAKYSVRLAPGKHRVVFETDPEWDTDPDLPHIALTLDVEAGDQDFVVLLRDVKKAEIAAPKAPAPPTVQAPSAPVPAETPADPYKALERLKTLRDEGVITDDEFKAKKAELLKSIR